MSMEEMHSQLLKDLGECGQVHQCMLCPDVQLSTQVRRDGNDRLSAYPGQVKWG